MRAITFSSFGTSDVLEISELPKPVPAQGEALVRVLASTVNPTDVMMRDGGQAELMKGLQPPYICGVEFCGVVEDAPGSAAFPRGTRVAGIVNARRPEGGAHAEFIKVPVASLVAIGEDVDPAEAATLIMNGLTAKMALEALGLPRGSVILVTGGAGAAGGYVIQLAREFGYDVVANARESDRNLLEGLGATLVVPRGGEAMETALRDRYPQGVDGLVDAALMGPAASPLVRDGGTAVALRRSNPITDPRLKPGYVMVFSADTDTASIEWVARMASDGRLTPRVALRLPMEQAAEAHRRVGNGGLRGRVVLMFDGRD